MSIGTPYIDANFSPRLRRYLSAPISQDSLQANYFINALIQDSNLSINPLLYYIPAHILHY